MEGRSRKPMTSGVGVNQFEMTPIAEQLHNDIWDKESELNKEWHQEPRKVDLIVMNLSVFRDLAREMVTSFNPTMVLRQNGPFEFEGIPIARTFDIEKWELRG